jgi:hypothetical protein
MYVPGSVKVTVVANAPSAENFTGAGPTVIVQLIRSVLASVAWPKRVSSVAGKASVFAGPASTIGTDSAEFGDKDGNATIPTNITHLDATRRRELDENVDENAGVSRTSQTSIHD